MQFAHRRLFTAKLQRMDVFLSLRSCDLHQSHGRPKGVAARYGACRC